MDGLIGVDDALPIDSLERLFSTTFPFLLSVEIHTRIIIKVNNKHAATDPVMAIVRLTKE